MTRMNPVPTKRLKVAHPSRICGHTHDYWRDHPHVLARVLGIGPCGFCMGSPRTSPGCYRTQAEYELAL